METLKNCILTGYNFEKYVEFLPTDENTIKYKFAPVGIVNVSAFALERIKTNPIVNPWILAGICRNAFINKKDPPTITIEFLDKYPDNIDYPRTFKEKLHVLLKYIYDSGGNNYKPIKLSAFPDYTIAFAEDIKEFVRLMEYGESHYLLDWKNKQDSYNRLSIFIDVLLTDQGIEEIEKDKPNLPMLSLATQDINTGNPQLDIKIDHAKKLFFKPDSTREDKRSACESLSFVLEPLRENLKSILSASDVSDFFNIINNFDIRHNKDHTKRIELEEQLEWVFYSLLNTINTYTKIIKKN
jgi:hypothetical protein